MISKARYEELRAKIDSFQEWVKENHTDAKTGWASYPAIEAKKRADYTTNEEIGLVEEYEWITDPPDRAFLYPKMTDRTEVLGHKHLGWVTNWVGIPFGVVTVRGSHWRSNFGDRRVNIRVRGSNKVDYCGTIYGTYVRLRRVK
jgi:hypothetical protein